MTDWLEKNILATVGLAFALGSAFNRVLFIAWKSGVKAETDKTFRTAFSKIDDLREEIRALERRADRAEDHIKHREEAYNRFEERVFNELKEVKDDVKELNGDIKKLLLKLGAGENGSNK